MKRLFIIWLLCCDLLHMHGEKLSVRNIKFVWKCVAEVYDDANDLDKALELGG